MWSLICGNASGTPQQALQQAPSAPPRKPIRVRSGHWTTMDYVPPHLPLRCPTLRRARVRAIRGSASLFRILRPPTIRPLLGILLSPLPLSTGRRWTGPPTGPTAQIGPRTGPGPRTSPGPRTVRTVDRSAVLRPSVPPSGPWTGPPVVPATSRWSSLWTDPQTGPLSREGITGGPSHMDRPTIDQLTAPRVRLRRTSCRPRHPYQTSQLTVYKNPKATTVRTLLHSVTVKNSNRCKQSLPHGVPVVALLTTGGKRT